RVLFHRSQSSLVVLAVYLGPISHSSGQANVPVRFATVFNRPSFRHDGGVGQLGVAAQCKAKSASSGFPLRGQERPRGGFVSVVEKGQFDKIKEYCLEDVRLTWKIYRRMTFGGSPE